MQHNSVNLISISESLATTLTVLVIALALFGFTVPVKAQQASQPDKFLVLATTRTRTMEDELNEAGARGYRVVAAQGGETAFGGNEAVVIMALDPRRPAFPLHPAGDQPHGHDAGRAQRSSIGIRSGRHDRVSVNLWRPRGRRHSRSRDRARMSTPCQAPW